VYLFTFAWLMVDSDKRWMWAFQNETWIWIRLRWVCKSFGFSIYDCIRISIL